MEELGTHPYKETGGKGWGPVAQPRAIFLGLLALLLCYG